MGPRAAYFACILAACGGSHATPRGAPAQAAADPTPPRDDRAASPAPAADLRALGADATFAELVRRAEGVEREPLHADALPGCVVQGTPDGVRLGAAFSVGLHPLPPAPADLADRLGAPASVHLLTPYGLRGTGDAPPLGLVSLTEAYGAGAPTLVVVVTPTAVLWVEASASGTAVRSLAVDAVDDALRGAAPREVIVTAEGITRVTRLAEVLEAVAAAGARAILAAALPANTMLPAPRAPDVPALGRCGAWPTPEAEGDLDPDATARALAPHVEAASSQCWLAHGAVAAGRAVRIRLRVAPDGRVERACVETDRGPVPPYDACLAERLATAQLPAPSPAGTVDLVLPVSVNLAPPAWPTPWCGPAPGAPRPAAPSPTAR